MASSYDDKTVDGWNEATKLVRSGVNRSGFDETAEALYLTSGYVYSSAAEAEAAFAGENDHYIYSRYANPTVAMFEKRLAAIEGAEACRGISSGMGAVFAALGSCVGAGDRLVSSRALFGSCHVIVTEILPRFGAETELVDGCSLEAWEKALTKDTKAVFLESPSNPALEIIDIEAVSRLAHNAGALVFIDNVFASPVLQSPLDLGADVVIYSATKHIDGQGRALGGAVLGTQEFVDESVMPMLRHTGPSLSPFNAWLFLKGMETMRLRVDASSRSAHQLSNQLEDTLGIGKVSYPFLESHPQFDLAQKQMSAGGTILTMDLGSKARAFEVLDKFKIIDISNNIGDSKSLATHPATTTHRRLGPEAREEAGIGPGMVRLSVGLEDVEDLYDDISQALGQSG